MQKFSGSNPTARNNDFFQSMLALAEVYELNLASSLNLARPVIANSGFLGDS